MSNIKVSVTWDKPAVFGGDDVECTITFRNAANEHSGSTSPATETNIRGGGRDRWLNSLHSDPNGESLRPSHPSTAPIETRRQGQRSSILSEPSHRLGLGAPNISPEKQRLLITKHSRTGSVVGSNGLQGFTRSGQNRPNHIRATSLQQLPNFTLQKYPDHKRPAPIEITNSNTTKDSVHPQLVGRDEGISSDFQEGQDVPSYKVLDRPVNAGRTIARQSRGSGVRGNDQSTLSSAINDFTSRQAPSVLSKERADPAPGSDTISHGLSAPSTSGSPRTSVDLYTMSNNSNETLVSEYPLSNAELPIKPRGHTRKPSYLAPVPSLSRSLETLMMAHAQLVGSFTLDGSLVNQSPFESVKKKGVIGGQGSGGVVGVDTARKDGSTLGGFGWSSLGQSLGGLLGSSEPSSIRDMKGIASTKEIPILSVPQSILFVDLTLSPGESRSFRYRHALPLGIPPSYRGRAIKIGYHLTIGVHRAQSKVQQHFVRQVNIPFKVLPGLDGRHYPLAIEFMLTFQ
jgi:hypothetical protein